MPENFKDKVLMTIFAGFVSFLFMLLAAWAMGIGQADRNITNELNKKADIEYVDQADQKQMNYIDTQNIKQDRTIETMRTETREDLKEINTKLDRIIEFQLKNR